MRFLLVICFFFFAGHGWAEQGDEGLFVAANKVGESMVVKVVSADTVVLENGQRIKMIGIESYGQPPRKYVKLDRNGRPIEEPVDPTIPMEEQAVYFAQNILEGKRVRIEYDVDATDEARRRQAYVFLPDGKLANAELLRQGFVKLKIRPPNLKYAQQLREAYQEARQQQRGFAQP